jgi:3-hydroxyacyl-CoA dehydrogenase
MHFFSPAHLMKLVEVVKAKQTAPWALAAVLQLTKAMGKVTLSPHATTTASLHRTTHPLLEKNLLLIFFPFFFSSMCIFVSLAATWLVQKKCVLTSYTQPSSLRIFKVACVVGNCDGFVGNRVLDPYSAEAAFLLEEGAMPEVS